MATMEITVTSQFSFEPDSVYLLEGAKIHMKVVEVYGNKKNGKLNLNVTLQFITYFYILN